LNQIIISTKNEGKAREFKEFFYQFNIKAVSLLDLDEKLPDVEETGSTFEENAALKAEQIASLLNTPVLADDSGLIIDALDGRPGLYSARYAGVPKNDQANIDKVLEELKDVPWENRSARFICVLAIAIPGEQTIFRTGFCEGKIAMKAKGENGFGYDPIFIPVNYDVTMAELTAEVKNEISHRRNAIRQLGKWIHSL
jgi:XTP/dITP diphosphohydrolase